MFASQYEEVPKKEEEKEEPQPQQQEEDLPQDVKQLLHVLINNNDLNTFIINYIDMLNNDSDNLISFINGVFNTKNKNIFEFLYNLHKTNSKQPWGIKSFFTTIVNLGIAIGDKGIPNFYYYMLLSAGPNPNSPIYGISEQIQFTKEQEELFKNKWNSLKPKSESFMNLKYNNKIIISVIVIAILLLLGGGYFLFRNKGISSNVPTPNVPVIDLKTVF